MLAQIGTWSLLVIAILVGLGGVMGFVKAKSKASLIAGIASAVAFLLAFAAALNGVHHAHMAGAVISIILCVVFGMRLRKTGKFMPSGLLLVLCAIELALMIAAHFAG
ncbi:MAG TPA: TMEM14 family protein [Candidatus Obscuribacterales bacterium]